MFNPLDFILNLFKRPLNAVLGVDIGTSSIKIVELGRGRDRSRFRLLNYAVMEINPLERSDGFRGLSFDLSDEELSRKIQLLIKESDIRTTVAVMSLPVFSTFVTVMRMPLLAEKELASAVPLQAREYIPIPIAEVVLDWKIIGTTKKSDLTKADFSDSADAQVKRVLKDGSSGTDSREESPASAGGSGAYKDASMPREAHIDILLMAAPREMVQKYVRIAQRAGLTILGLEIESFALARTLGEDGVEATLLLDVGAFSSSAAVFDQGFLRLVHSVGVSGVELTRAASRALGTDTERAEAHKQSWGLYAQGGEKEIATAYLPILENLSRDIERVISAYWRTNRRRISRIALSGNSAHMAGFDAYLASRIRIPVSPINPFEKVDIPKDLTPVSLFLSPGLASAVGLAMKEI